MLSTSFLSTKEIPFLAKTCFRDQQQQEQQQQHQQKCLARCSSSYAFPSPEVSPPQSQCLRRPCLTAQTTWTRQMSFHVREYTVLQYTTAVEKLSWSSLPSISRTFCEQEFSLWWRPYSFGAGMYIHTFIWSPLVGPSGACWGVDRYLCTWCPHEDNVGSFGSGIGDVATEVALLSPPTTTTTVRLDTLQSRR